MKKILLSFLVLPVLASAAQDSLAPVTFLHTKVVLSAPHHSGEIIAEFDHNPEKSLLSFRRLAIKIGTQSVNVPKQILDFFTGPQPGTLQFFIEPHVGRDSTSADSFRVSFRYVSYSYDGLDSPVEYPTGSIYIKNASLRGIASWEKGAEGPRKVEFYDSNMKRVPSLP